MDVTMVVSEVRSPVGGAQPGELGMLELEKAFLVLHANMPVDTPETCSRAVEHLIWVVEGHVAVLR